MAEWFNRVFYSAVGDVEDYSAADAGWWDVVEQGGAITGLEFFGNYFFVFQEKNYTVYQYQVGDNPVFQRKTFNYGCSHGRTIVKRADKIYYLSDVGDVRVTNGYQDICLSEKIKPLVLGLLNSRSIKDYYSGTAPNCVPNAYWDDVNNAYVLHYAGTSSNTDKCLIYFEDTKIFTTIPSTAVLASISTYGFTDYIAMLGNSGGTGITNSLDKKFASTDTTGTLDLGWLSSGKDDDPLKLYSVELWVQAEAGETAADDCDCTLSVAVYNDPTGGAVLKTVTNTLEYNSVQDNIIKLFFPINQVGEFMRLVLSDSGSKTNYAIERIIIKFEKLTYQEG